MKQVILSNGYLLQEVPQEKGYVDYYWIGTDNNLYANCGQLDWKIEDVKLPEGDWNVVENADMITEEQAKEISEVIDGDGHIFIYKDYTDADAAFFQALESFESLLRSHEMKKETTIILYNKK